MTVIRKVVALSSSSLVCRHTLLGQEEEEEEEEKEEWRGHTGDRERHIPKRHLRVGFVKITRRRQPEQW